MANYFDDIAFDKLNTQRNIEKLRLKPIIQQLYDSVLLEDKKPLLLNKWVMIPDEPYEYTLISNIDGWRIFFRQTTQTDENDLFTVYNPSGLYLFDVENPNNKLYVLR